MSLHTVRHILREAASLGSVEAIYFEGGEPFLYYAVLLKGVQEAARMGFRVGIVSNGYWATEADDAVECLKPLAGLLEDLSISSDLYHWDEKLSRQAKNACAAAERLGIPIGVISVAQAEGPEVEAAVGQLPVGESGVMYRGRAADMLGARTARRAWQQFTTCPYEDLREPGRVHVDAFGNLHICQGISIGNIFRMSLREVCENYNPESHPITAPLLAGGPAELARCYGLPLEDSYADACHLCYDARRALRTSFPEILVPDQMYGVF
jgi:MoaA/NifB/PqqE/SkfB family radical SAM enzyme